MKPIFVAVVTFTLGVLAGGTVNQPPDYLVCEAWTLQGAYYHAVEDDGRTHCNEIEVTGL